ncbi:MAG: sel1 repeat family protein [Candidatus Methanomethylophilaceae archaeon]|nr:sel1 repeat family protein [Candidatus Methanomethylophilaceae archaeon]
MPVRKEEKESQEDLLVGAESSAVGIDIWGVCVDRDVFRVMDDFRGSEGRLKINNYFKACSFVSQFSKRNGPTISVSDMPLLRSEKMSFNTGITKKTALADYNKTIIRQLRHSGSEWLLIDGRADAYGISRIQYSDGSCDYLSSKTQHRFGISEILWSKGIENTTEDIGLDYPEEEYQRCFKRLVKFVKERYGNNIILNCAFDSTFFLDMDGLIHETSNERIVARNAFLARFNLEFVRATGCYCIKCPMYQMADAYHRWGLYTVHYIEEHYMYIDRCIQAIIDGGDGVRDRLEDLFLEYSALFASVRSGEVLSVRNGIERFQNLKEEERRDEAMEILDQMIRQGLPQAKVELAKLYGYGVFVEKDLSRAESLINEAIEDGMRSSASALFDIYWNDGDPGNYEKMIKAVEPGVEEGDRGAILRMGRACC